jgi:hypothetical protein
MSQWVAVERLCKQHPELARLRAQCHEGALDGVPLRLPPHYAPDLGATLRSYFDRSRLWPGEVDDLLEIAQAVQKHQSTTLRTGDAEGQGYSVTKVQMAEANLARPARPRNGLKDG